LGLGFPNPSHDSYPGSNELEYLLETASVVRHIL
jgi:hypothetical protein